MSEKDPPMIQKRVSDIDRVMAQFISIPTWKLITLLVGLTQIALSFTVLGSPHAGIALLIRSLLGGDAAVASSYFANLLGLCGVVMILKPEARIAPHLIFPLFVLAISEGDYIWSLAATDPDRHLITVIALAGLLTCAYLAMIKDRLPHGR